jgi:hypothetical protein
LRRQRKYVPQSPDGLPPDGGQLTILGFLPTSRNCHGRPVRLRAPGDSYRAGYHLSFTVIGTVSAAMGSDHDPRHHAEEAMRQAVSTDGMERQRWIRLAQAWLELARTRPMERGVERTS